MLANGKTATDGLSGSARVGVVSAGEMAAALGRRLQRDQEVLLLLGRARAGTVDRARVARHAPRARTRSTT